MSQTAQHTATYQRPKDAATLIIVNTEHSPPRVLMGRRQPAQVFLPNKFVFPGGRVDRCDHHAKATGSLAKDDISKLLFDMKGAPSNGRALALALAAIRETFEETGLMIGDRDPPDKNKAQPSDTSWQKFQSARITPDLNNLRFVARAITPPGRTRRYDTRFFCVNATHIALKTAPQDNELLDQKWVSLAETRLLDLPHITRAIIEDIGGWLSAGAGFPAPSDPVPYYFYAHGTFERQLITASPIAP